MKWYWWALIGLTVLLVVGYFTNWFGMGKKKTTLTSTTTTTSSGNGTVMNMNGTDGGIGTGTLERVAV